MSPVELEGLPVDLGLMRVVKHTPPLFVPPDYVNPTWRAFRLTDQDVEESRIRGREPGLSVFDVQRSSATSALNIRNDLELRHRARPLGPANVYVTNVARLREVTRRIHLSAFHDPLPDPDDPTRLWDREGADGHAVLEGLYEENERKQESPAYKDMLARVARAVELV